MTTNRHKDPYEYDCDDECDETIVPLPASAEKEKRKYVKRHGGSCCCVPGCKNKSSQVLRRSGRQVSFHKLPSVASDYHIIWKAAIGCEDKPLPASSRVCSDHFRPSDFYVKPAGTGRCPRLLPSAVPSLSSPLEDPNSCEAPPEDICKDEVTQQQRRPVHRLFESFLTDPDAGVAASSPHIMSGRTHIPDESVDISFLAPTKTHNVLHSTPRSHAQQRDASTSLLSRSSDFRSIGEWRNYAGDIQNVSDQFKAAAAAKQAEISSLNLQLQNLKAEIELLAEQNDRLSKATFSFENLQSQPSKFKYYTGLSPAMFRVLLTFLDPDVIQRLIFPNYLGKDPTKRRGRRLAKSPPDMLLLTLVRLRRGLGLQDLAFRMDISVNTASVVFNNIVSLMNAKFKETNIWPSRADVDKHMPSAFKKHFPTTRVVVDCTEIPTGRPQDPVLQQYLWSNYKSCHTWKGLVGISPGGAVTVISDLCGGSVTDAKLTEESGLLDLLQRGDSVLADRGFLCTEMLSRIGVTLDKPPSLLGRAHFDDADVAQTRRIANCRIFIEHAMRRLKIWRVLDYMPASMHGMASQIFYVCGYLCNFSEPLVPPDNELYLSDPSEDEQ